MANLPDLRRLFDGFGLKSVHFAKRCLASVHGYILVIAAFVDENDIWSWTVVGWFIAILLGVWGVMLGINELAFANWCFIVSSLLLFAKIITWSINRIQSASLTYPVILVAFLIICSLAAGELWWVDRRQTALINQLKNSDLTKQPPASNFPSPSEFADELAKRLPKQSPSEDKTGLKEQLATKIIPDPKKPVVEQIVASCHLSNNSRCELTCTIENMNTVPVRDAVVGFNGYLPALTQIAAPPDHRVRLEKSDTLPVPDPSGEVDRSMRAFSVHVPLVPTASKVTFNLWTDDENNKKACFQYQKIRTESKPIVERFIQKAMDTGHLARNELPDVNFIFLAMDKRDGLFLPDMLLSELGRSAVRFKTAGEEVLLKRYQEVYSYLKPKFPEIFENKIECMAPVFTVEQTGEKLTTFATFPPDIKTYIEGTIKLPDKLSKETTVMLRPTPPPKYICGPKN